jgi:hypothetical protein
VLPPAAPVISKTLFSMVTPEVDVRRGSGEPSGLGALHAPPSADAAAHAHTQLRPAPLVSTHTRPKTPQTRPEIPGGQLRHPSGAALRHRDARVRAANQVGARPSSRGLPVNPPAARQADAPPSTRPSQGHALTPVPLPLPPPQKPGPAGARLRGARAHGRGQQPAPHGQGWVARQLRAARVWRGGLQCSGWPASGSQSLGSRLRDRKHWGFNLKPDQRARRRLAP